MTRRIARIARTLEPVLTFLACFLALGAFIAVVENHGGGWSPAASYFSALAFMVLGAQRNLLRRIDTLKVKREAPDD